MMSTPEATIIDTANKSISKLQARFRGSHSRNLHVSRKKSGALIVCPDLCSPIETCRIVIEMASITSTDFVLDLGCGDGTVLIEIAANTRAQCVGYEIDHILCARAVRKSISAGVQELVNIEQKDLSFADFSNITVLYMFLVPSCLNVLSSILKQKVSKNCRIVTYYYPLPIEDGWIPVQMHETIDAVNKLNSESRKSLYLYFNNKNDEEL